MTFTRIAGTGATDAVIRPDVAGWQHWSEVFIDTLKETGNISIACDTAGISRVSAYNRRRANKAFREAWDEAIQSVVDDLEGHAFRRAKQSDVILMFMLRKWRPERYEDKKFTLGAEMPDGTTVTIELQEGRENADIIGAIAAQLDGGWSGGDSETATTQDTEGVVGNNPLNDRGEDSQYESVRESHFTV